MMQDNAMLKRFLRTSGALLAFLCASFILRGQTAHHAPGPGLYPPVSKGTAHRQLLRGKMLSGFRDNRKDTTDAFAGVPLVSQTYPQAWDYRHLALFCKLEVQMDKVFRLPVRIRLGDVPYVDWLEGKRKAY